VLLENVPFMLQLGRGEAMNVITTTLETLNYRWLIASSTRDRSDCRSGVAASTSLLRCVRIPEACCSPMRQVLSKQLRRWVMRLRSILLDEGTRGLGWAVDAIPTLKGGSSLGIPSSPAILLSNGEIVTPNIRDAERLQGFSADWTQLPRK